MEQDFSVVFIMTHLCTINKRKQILIFLEDGFIFQKGKGASAMLKKDIRRMKTNQPLYIRLYEHLREYIQSEQAREIGKLPKELELCRMFGVSRNTVSQALFMLEEEQLICRIKHRGTFLSSALNEFDPQSIRRTIGAVFPESSAWSDAIGAIRSGCRKLGYEFRLFTYPWQNPEGEMKVIRRAEKSCGGLIFYPGGTEKSSEYIQSKSGSYPFVLFDLYVIGSKCNLVSTDHFQGAYSLARTLIWKGCRRFAVLEKEQKNSSIRLRLSGYIQALEDHGVEFELIRDTGKVWKKGGFDAVLDPDCTRLHEAPCGAKIWLARFDSADKTEENLYYPLIARQDKTALGINAVTLMKEIMRSGMTPERSVLIVPEIIEPKELS